MIIGYARVSTKSQANDGNSLEFQQKILKENGAEKIYIDSFSGTKKNRPQFDKLLLDVKAGDVVIVTKLDRFARSLMNGNEIISDLINKGVTVNILNLGVLNNKPSSKLIRNIFFSFAEFERDMILERTQEGKAIAKQREDFREGRPKKYTKKQIKHALELLNSNSYNQVAEMTGISKSTLIREKNKL